MDISNSNRFCTCFATRTRRASIRVRHHFLESLTCDCGEMSARDEVFDWTFEGGEMTETAEVRDGSRGREIEFDADWRS